MTNDIDKTTSSAKGEHLAAGGIDKAKRSLMSKAAVIAPVALVAMSRPAWGDKTGTKFICGISGMISGNVSKTEDDHKCNGGYSPGYWGNKNGWCSWEAYHDILFSDLFGSTSCTGESYDYTGKTLGEVLGPNNAKAATCSDDDFVLNNVYDGSLGWHAIAAWLNSLYVDDYIFQGFPPPGKNQVVDLVTTVMAEGSVDIGDSSYDCGQLKALFDSTY